MIILEPGAAEAIRSFLAENRVRRPLRVELGFSGCCDPALSLRVDDARESDLVHQEQGLTFLIDAETAKLVGDVTISRVEEVEAKRFLLTSSNPLSEWAGFGPVEIKT